jgi:uncharacterized iron-regulated membrane protein
MKNKKNRTIGASLRPFYRWHRRVGIIAVFFVIVLCITGILLNHNAQLGLHKNAITSTWILELYQMDAAPESDFAYPEILTTDQLVLDIHTGRILGKLGPLLMDVVAIMLLILSLSGCYMWLKRTQKSGRKKR